MSIVRIVLCQSSRPVASRIATCNASRSLVKVGEGKVRFSSARTPLRSSMGAFVSFSASDSNHASNSAPAISSLEENAATVTRACCPGPSTSQSAGGKIAPRSTGFITGSADAFASASRVGRSTFQRACSTVLPSLFFASSTSSSGAGEVVNVTRAVKGEFPDTSSAFRSTSLPSRYAASQCSGAG